jgi:hypothetical protein
MHNNAYYSKPVYRSKPKYCIILHVNAELRSILIPL